MYNDCHMENIFEIGCICTQLVRDGKLEVDDSKYLFVLALGWATEFEKKYENVDWNELSYYEEIDMFTKEKIKEAFNMNDL